MTDIVEGLAFRGKDFIDFELSRTQKMETVVEREIPSDSDEPLHGFTMAVEPDEVPTLYWALGWYKVALKEAKKRLEAEDDKN